ncbi:MAG TPA: ABC-F family ATP-binding cassette domain-containing protein [Candidatus Dormibacteraeota bacterium]|nr:ABC-F family ATP-binding cassette domain-containing protein [Candidatus Dormibacteraeota bacterium]
MITVTDLTLRAGARTLLEAATFTIGRGDRVGLVGRNGAGKTTLARVLSGEALADGGGVVRSGAVGYLPQGPSEGDMSVLARDRILSGRGMDAVLGDLRAAADAMAAGEPGAIERYGRLEDRLIALGGYGAEAEAASIAASLGLPARLLDHRLRELSGGQRRRVELARILFGGADTLLLDEPTNHLDADSITWLRDFLRAHRGGLVVISHDVELLEATVNRVFHLDANRAALDVYNVGWRAYREQREQDDRRRRRERANAEKKASALMAQADRMRSTATLAKTALAMERRAERLLAGAAEVRRSDRVARLRFPDPQPCGRVPLTARGLSKGYGSTEVFTGVDVEVERASRTVVLGVNGAGKTTLLRVLAGLEQPDAGVVAAGHGLKLGYYAQEHETLDARRTVLENMQAAAPEADARVVRGILGSFLFSGDAVDQEVRTLSGGEKTRLALAVLVVSGANLLLLDEPTNNLDPASRDEVLSALAGYRGAVLLVTHDEGAVQALQPQRVILMPEGIADWWDASLSELVSLA